jgi:hypothetical protein
LKRILKNRVGPKLHKLYLAVQSLADSSVTNIQLRRTNCWPTLFLADSPGSEVPVLHTTPHGARSILGLPSGEVITSISRF